MTVDKRCAINIEVRFRVIRFIAVKIFWKYKYINVTKKKSLLNNMMHKLLEDFRNFNEIENNHLIMFG